MPPRADSSEGLELGRWVFALASIVHPRFQERLNVRVLLEPVPNQRAEPRLNESL